MAPTMMPTINMQENATCARRTNTHEEASAYGKGCVYAKGKHVGDTSQLHGPVVFWRKMPLP
jgi:hypothetical protein